MSVKPRSPSLSAVKTLAWRFPVAAVVAALFGIGIALIANPPGIAQTRDADTSQLFDEAVQRAVQRVSPNVVQLEILTASDPQAGKEPALGPRTAVVLSPDGWGVTAASNLPTGSAVALGFRTADGQLRSVQWIVTDETCDLALLKLDGGPWTDLTAAPLSEIKPGQTAIAVGKSFHPDQANVSVGIVSATNRHWGKVIQTDAKISPRNYGGALVDVRGRVLGILTPMVGIDDEHAGGGADWYDSGIGFAVPLETLRQRLPRWQAEKNLRGGRSGMGWVASQEFPGNPTIESCWPGSPAAKAGLRQGDTIRFVNDRPTPTRPEFRFAWSGFYAGDRVTLRVADESGASREVALELVETLPDYYRAALGVRPAPTQPDQLIIQQVVAGSAAQKAGLAAGDQLVAWDNEPLQSWSNVRRRVRAVLPGQQVRLQWKTPDQGERSAAVELTEMSAAVLPVPEATPLQELAAREGTLTEFDNPFWVLRGGETREPIPVLLWLAPPGPLSRDRLLNEWQGLRAHPGLVIVVGSADPERWLPDDVEAILRALAEGTRGITIDPERIAVGGDRRACEQAARVASARGDLVRGLILRHPEETGRWQFEPANPQQAPLVLALFHKGGVAAPSIPWLETPLRAARLPFTAIQFEGDESQAGLIALQWLQTLDRL